MKNILLIGAGKSTPNLIKYLSEKSLLEDWTIDIVDLKTEHVNKFINGNSRVSLYNSDIFSDNDLRENLISNSDIVISMLPVNMHIEIARNCIKHKKNLVTASYVSEQMKELEKDVLNSNLLFMNECGVDPGIDHMSAMQIIDNINEMGCEVIAFESFTGGLLAPDSEKDNPWKYKFTWNPRNVVLAGQGGAAKFIQEGKYKYIPYHKIFRRTEVISIENYGKFVGYANRDSLKYRSVYRLDNARTFFRGTLRRPGFCTAWDVFVQLGMTDDSYIIDDSENMTYRDFINTFLAYSERDSVELKLQHYLHIDQDSDIMEKLEWIGIFEERKIGLKNATPAQILQRILEQKWTLEDDERDMVVMFHKIDYIQRGKRKQIQSHMVVEGKDKHETAMAKTVGLPVGIITKLILRNSIPLKGINIPIDKSVYSPVLKELQEYNIVFKEKYFDVV